MAVHTQVSFVSRALLEKFTSGLKIARQLNVGANTVSLKRKNRSRSRRRRGSQSRLRKSLSMGVIIGIVALPFAYVLDPSLLRSAGKTRRDAVRVAVAGSTETSITEPRAPRNIGTQDGDAEAELIPKGSRLGHVQPVVDGDTLYLQGGEKIRLYGIDVPERNQSYGKQSTSAFREIIGDSVYVDRRDVDRYGREVAVLYTREGVNVKRGRMVVRTLRTTRQGAHGLPSICFQCWCGLVGRRTNCALGVAKKVRAHV